MDLQNGGQENASELQRKAAAEIARRKVLAAYAKNTNDAEKAASKQNSSNQTHLKDSPAGAKINSESWKKYHTAWQDYYQKYYSEYYSNAAREYVAKEKLKEEREKAEEDEIISAIAKAGGSETASGLKMRVQKKAAKSIKKTRKMRKFIPLILGATVTLTILFLQYNRMIFAPIMAYVSPGNAPPSSIEAIDPTITQTVSADPRLIIPKLNVDVPVRYEIPLSGVMSAMNNGVAHYRIAGASAYPGQVGNFIITGHSAGDIYSSNPYKYIFSGLERLEDGDLIYVNYQSKRYTYRVVKKEVIEPTNVAALVVETKKPLITLVTCTPLGTSRYRLLVTGEQISPAVGENVANPEPNPSNTSEPNIDEAILPANEPSFFEGIWNWLTGN